MKLHSVLFILIAGVLSQVEISYAQQKSDESDRLSIYSRLLRIDSVKSVKIFRIQEEYRARLCAVIADREMSAETKAKRIKALLEDKDRNIRAVTVPLKPKLAGSRGGNLPDQSGEQ